MIMEASPLKLDDSDPHCEHVNTSVNGISSSAPICDLRQLPVKKPKRQWAAWTRQEEESFFTALRQFGKNFEKITRRVQSKNKDQVRHYYYRLVRRMNKLLGPELSLNSKNPKDTNAAMLRWWSLLEKYSCKSSKLHLKPRRFKLFVEALETQLLKDKKKNTRKREIPFPLSPNSETYYDRQAPNDQSMVKLVLVCSQNIDKLSNGKGLVSRNSTISPTNVTNGESSSSLKPTRHKQKQAMTSSAAYKRWEKAAIAGMSLVADAAEHLERTTKNNDSQNELPGREVLHSCSNTKLKLQLFPFDEATRRTLEIDKHNPFLELTLSNKKKISSIIEHLNKKWGKSSLENRMMFLFPYCAEGENAFGRQYWTLNSSASAADAFAAIGSPSIFILRYGWFSEKEFNQNALGSSQLPLNNEPNIPNKDFISKSSPSLDIIFNLAADELGYGQCSEPEKSLKAVRYFEDVGLNMDPITTVEWGESLTNISIGDLLLDEPPIDNPFTSEMLQNSFTCDSFDTAIAAHLLKHEKPAIPASDLSSFSLWDAEETCDGFSFQNTNTVQTQTVPANIEINTAVLEQPLEAPQDVKTSTVLTDMYWPESLGPLDELPSCKYQESELILSDSFSGLNRLIANSLDAFQNINFLGGQEKIVSHT